ncbi:MAG: TetR-like C-terminal domain-containing protein [Clostridiaceae bacterium]|nr:TetR-like C-terminal domain-containing protein [Clostridiaceae bacterium]
MSQFTKKAIKESFVKLLNERPFDKITIKDVVEDCGINRNTFYYYYQDIFALLDDIFESEANDVIGSGYVHDSWQEGFIKSAGFAMRNKSAIFHVYNSINRQHLERYLYKVSEDLMEGIVKSEAEGLNVSDEDIRLVSVFYKHAIVGLFLEWLQRGMKDEPEYIIRRMGRLLDGNIRNILARAEKESQIGNSVSHVTSDD